MGTDRVVTESLGGGNGQHTGRECKRYGFDSSSRRRFPILFTPHDSTNIVGLSMQILFLTSLLFVSEKSFDYSSLN